MVALQETEEMLRQFDHLSRNGCQIILSLIELEKSGVTDLASLRLLNTTARRVNAVFTVVDCLDRQGEILVDLADIARRVARGCVEANRITMGHCALELSLATLHATPEVAINFAIATSELVSNALEHAFPDIAGGTVVVALERTSGGARLSVRDDGIGFSAVQHKDGLGLRLVRSLAAELDGRFSVAREKGTLALVDFPV